MVFQSIAAKHNDHTIKLVRSENGEDGSAMLIHLSKKYCSDWTRELINLYNLATNMLERLLRSLQLKYQIMAG